MINSLMVRLKFQYNLLLSEKDVDSPLVKWCILAISLICVWLWLLVPLQNWKQSLGLQIEQNAKKSVRLTALKNKAEEWAVAEQEAVTALEKAMRSLFLQSSDTSAQAAIQQLLRQLCAKHNIVIESQKLLESEVYPVLGSRLAVGLSLRGDLSDILGLLDDISNAKNLLQIERWVIRLERNKTVLSQLVIAGFRADAEVLSE